AIDDRDDLGVMFALEAVHQLPVVRPEAVYPLLQLGWRVCAAVVQVDLVGAEGDGRVRVKVRDRCEDDHAYAFSAAAYSSSAVTGAPRSGAARRRRDAREPPTARRRPRTPSGPSRPSRARPPCGRGS